MKNSQELYNVLAHHVLSEVVINESYRHIMLPICFFDSNINEIKKLNSSVYDSLKNDFDNESKLSIFIYERYFKMETLEEYIKSEFKNMTTKHWKVLFFQVLFILAKLNENYKKTRTLTYLQP